MSLKTDLHHYAGLTEESCLSEERRQGVHFTPLEEDRHSEFVDQ